MMILLLPLALLVYLLKSRIAFLFKNRSLGFSFIFLSTLFGLFTEGFAILDNLKKPLEERILMSPYPLTDLAFGIFYYGLVSIVWYFLLKCYSYSKKEVFFLTGIVLGLGTEQMGKVFLGMFASLSGFWIGLMVICIYGAFPALAYYITKERFSPDRKSTGVLVYLLTALVLLMEWAIFGILILPVLKIL